MAPETQENGTSTETEETTETEQQQTTPETGANGSPQQVTIDDSTKLPETHPLVKTLAANKTKLSTLTSELNEARAQSAKASQLEEELSKRPTTEALETLQTRYDRLEAFLTEAGGPLSKALDSRTFTKALFESDKDIADIVKEWRAANPTETSAALGAGAGTGSSGKHDPNDLIRIAAGKK